MMATQPSNINELFVDMKTLKPYYVEAKKQKIKKVKIKQLKLNEKYKDIEH